MNVEKDTKMADEQVDRWRDLDLDLQNSSCYEALARRLQQRKSPTPGNATLDDRGASNVWVNTLVLTQPSDQFFAGIRRSIGET